VVYGAVDGLFLSSFPILAVFAAFAGTRLRARTLGKIGIGLAALIASMLMTTAYHLGYSDFRSSKIARPVAGDVVWSVPTLVTSIRSAHPSPTPACTSPPYCTPHKPTDSSPHTNSQSAGLLSAAAERQSCVVHALPNRRRQCHTALGLLPSCSAMSFCDSSHLIQCNQLSRLGGAEPRMLYPLASIAD
jgi:hypothetical protein